MARPMMHLAQFLMHSPTYHSVAMWRHPRSTTQAMDWARPELYQHIARVCERGLFDMVFFADLNFISDTYTGSIDPAIRYATQVPNHDPLPLLSWMAAVTTHIGLAATASVVHQQPFDLARTWATLDHLTRGRVAWNVVTSINHNQAANYGQTQLPTESRYERAEEFLEVCRALWDSWSEDAVVADRASGVFADPARVRRIHHQGRHYACAGPLNVVRSPQGGPVILQAGASPAGRAFAARHAEGIFAIQPSVPLAREYHADIKARVAAAGRDPDGCKILYGVQPIVGSSRGEAEALQAEHNALVPVEAGLTILSGHADFDCSKLPLDEPIDVAGDPGLARMARVFQDLDGRVLSLREVARRHGQSVGLPQMVGTAVEVADQMQHYFETVGGDGFMLSPIYTPGAIERFVDEVVPELQRRGLFRRHYAGSTQREHLMQTL